MGRARAGVALAFLMVLGPVALGACNEEEAAAPPETEEAAPPETEEAAPPEVEHPYDEEANAKADIERAVAAAKDGGKRVLMVFGGNWCKWCRRLEHVLRHHEDVKSALDRGFEVVHVDTGARKSGKNADVNEKYGDPAQHGLPALVVLDGDGKVVTVQETGSLEVGPRHDPEKVLAFLDRVKAP